MVDLLTVIPIWVTANKVAPAVEDVSTISEAVLYILFGLNTTRILRALRIRKKLSNIDDAVNRYLAEMTLAIIVMILFFAAIMQFLEKSVRPVEFHTWMYYIWVTIATVGYGDIVPYTTLGI